MRGYELGEIPAVPLPRKLTPKLLSVPGKLAGAVSAASAHLDRIQAEVLVGFGGYVATPGYLAARRRRIRSSSTRPTRCPGWPTASAPG